MKKMREITIHPESEEQFETVKAVLEALKVPFESASVSLPESAIKSIIKVSNSLIMVRQFLCKHLKKNIYVSISEL